MAAWTQSAASATETGPYCWPMAAPPSERTETRTPVRPRSRYCMAAPKKNEPQSHRGHRGKKHRERNRVKAQPWIARFSIHFVFLGVSSLGVLCDSVVRL